MALGGVTRGISIALSLATQGFNAGLNSASGALNNFASGSQRDLNSVGMAAGAMGAAVGVGLGLAVGAAMDFESAMSEVAAVSGTTGKEFDRLRDQALDLGASTAYSATEVAGAQAELLKAGVSTADVMGGALKGALDLAAAAQIDVAQAAEITSNVLNTFSLSGREASHVADVLAAAANKSAADVSDIGLAMKQAGAAASLTGMELEETAGALSIFANAGVKGSDAGTSLKTMLLRLKPATAEARAEMEKYGISFETQEGGFVDLADVAETLQTRLGHLGDAQRVQTLQTIFGTDAIRAATMLYQQGGEGVDYWTQQVDDAGYAAEVARIRMDNLKGDLEKLGGAIDTVLIEAGSEANGALRAMTQAATDTVSALGNMPPVVSQVSIGAGGLAIAATAAVAGLGTFIPMARNVKGAMDGMGGAWSSLAGTMTMRNFASMAAGAGILAGAFVLVSSQLEGAKRRAKEANDVFRSSLEAPTDLAGFVSYNAAIETELNRLQGRLDAAYMDVEGGAGNIVHGWQRFSEAVGIWGEDVIYETTERLKDLIDTQHVAASEGMAYATIVDDIGKRYGWTTEQVEAFADANGIDLASSAASAIAILAEEGNAVEVVNGALSLTPAAASNVAGVLDNELTPAMDAAVTATISAPPVVTETSDAMTTLGDSSASTADKIDALTSIVEAFIGIALGEGEASDALQSSINGIGEAAAAAGWNFHGTTDEAIAFRDQMREVTTDAGALINAWIEQGIKGDELRAKVEGLSTSLYDQAIAAGVPRAVVDEYLGVLGQLPPDVYTNIQTPNLPGALTDVNAFNGALDAIERERFARIHVEYPGRNVGSMIFNADGNILAFADGGHHAQIARGGPTRIWNEPETGGESYIPWAQSKRGRSVEILRQTNAAFGNPLGAGGGGGIGSIHVTVNAPGVYDSRGLEEQIRRGGALQDAIATAVTRANGARDGARP
jgi:TP901 family phage tail tape measure protein